MNYDMMKVVKVIKPEDLIGENYVSYIQNPKVGDRYWQVYYGHAIQLEYTQLRDREKEALNPGIYTIRKEGYNVVLKEKEVLLEPDVPGVNIANISDKIKVFLDKHEFFSSRGLIPKRGVMLHGPPGCGKTHSLNKCVLDIVGKNGVAIYVAMDEVRISDLVSLLEGRELNKNVDKLMIIIEDLGGGEITDKKKGFVLPSTSDLLALLDGNSLPWKTLPTIMLSTTNYPKNFLANILDRPGRFDEIIEFSLPDGETALKYAESLDVTLTDFAKQSILKGGVGLAHVKEAVVKYAVYGDAIHNTIEAMRERTKQIEKDLDEKMNLF